MSAHPILPSGYGDWLKSLKSRIVSARQRAALAVNQELVTLYHSIGKDILQRQASEGWGAKVIQRLSTDLGEAFPDMKGFSTRNLKYMKFFAEFCPGLQFGQQPAAQSPWFHIISLLTKIPDPAAREWYVMDLLFYHDAFEPGHAGQPNFYLAAVDAQIKAADDNPTIGLLLC